MTQIQLKTIIYPPLFSPSQYLPLHFLPPRHRLLTTVNPPKLTSSFKPISYSLSFDHSHLSLTNGSPNSAVYGLILHSCESPILGKSIHGHVVKSGFHRDEFVGAKLVQMYGRNGCLWGACKVFDEITERNLYSWLAVISVHVECELYEEALSLFLELLYEDVRLDFFVFPVVLKICSGLREVGIGKQVHGFVVKTMFVSNVYVGNGLIDMYGKCGLLGDAKKVFSTMNKTDSVSWNCLLSACSMNGMVGEALDNLDDMSNLSDVVPNVVSWSAVISGFAQNGYASEAIELLSRMRARGVEPNAQTIAGVLPAFAKLESPRLAKEIHAYITRCAYMTNSIVVNGLLDVYRRCGDMGSAWKLFLRYSVKNVVSFNTMIVGFCENGNISKAKSLLNEIEVHGIKRDLITWNAMLSGYVDNDLFEEALNLFGEMLTVEGREVSSYTVGSVLSACSGKSYVKLGKEVHCQSIKRGLNSNPFVAEALMELYFRSRHLKFARRAFDDVLDRDIAIWNNLITGYARLNQMDDLPILLHRMKQDGFDPNIHTWNGMISGHVENGHHETALQLFLEMQTTNLRPDIYTVGIILPTCSKLATIERGKQVHGYSVRCGYDSEVYVGAALVDMYSKCGSIKYAIMANNRILKPNLVSQNTLLTAYATHGLGEEGISLFHKIMDSDFTPDEVTFLSALSACAHSGKVEIGRKIFTSMGRYNVKVSLKHYTSMVDLFSRGGKISEAYEFIESMPMQPDSVTWGALLSGCVSSGNVELGEVVAEKLLELEPDNTGNYVLLANLYAHSGKWSDLKRVRKIITERKMRKSAGCSWIEDGNDLHVFTANDTSHRRVVEIYSTLQDLTMHMQVLMDHVIM